MKYPIQTCFFHTLLLAFLFESGGTGLPEKHEQFEGTESPDRKWIVCGPTSKGFDENAKNFLLDAKTGEIFVTLIGSVGRPHMNHMDIEARWSSDSKNLLWTVHSKWGPASVIFLQIQEDGTVIQIDLRQEAVDEILKRLQQKFPPEYEATSRANESASDYYPDGFTVDIRSVGNDPAPPFEFYVAATSSPKRIPIHASDSEGFMIDGFLTGRLARDRALSWRDFLSKRHGSDVNEGHQDNSRQRLENLERMVAARLSGDRKDQFLRESRDWLRQLKETCADFQMSFSDHFSRHHEMESIRKRIASLEKLLEGQPNRDGSSAASAKPDFWDEIPVSPSTTIPDAIRDGYWHSQFKRVNREIAKANQAQVIFFGDSITLRWSLLPAEGKPVWQERFAKYNPINMGNSGDITPVMLYRVTHGNLDFARGREPRVAVLLCGTNNYTVKQSAGGKVKWDLGIETPAEDVAHGVRAVAREFRRRLPGTRVILLGILPVKNQAKWIKCKESNRINAGYRYPEDEVVFLDLQNHFLNADGSLKAEMFVDGTHLTTRGYATMADELEPVIDRLLKLGPRFSHSRLSYPLDVNFNHREAAVSAIQVRVCQRPLVDGIHWE